MNPVYSRSSAAQVRRSLLRLVAAAVLAVYCTCSRNARQLPDDLVEVFAQWFVRPDSSATSYLASYDLTPDRIDSLVRVIGRRDDLVGRHAVVLGDGYGNEYTLGYATPEHFQRQLQYPLVVYLHGGIGTRRTDKGRYAYDMLSFLADSLSLFLASPSANREAPWWSAAGLTRILQTVRFMSIHYPVDPDRVFLAGVSDGATGCYAAANTICGPFAGFISISGFGGILPALGMQLNPTNLMQRRIYNVNAGRDRLYPLQQVLVFLDRLVEQGVPVERKIYADEQHGFDYRDREASGLTHIVRTWRRPRRKSVSWRIVPNLPNAPDNLLLHESCTGHDAQFIHVYLRKDTLHLRSPAQCPYHVLVDANLAGTQLPVRSADGTIKRLWVKRFDAHLALTAMQIFCFPHLPDKATISITP